ncbi:MAG TPA: hypothetical protein VFM53_02295 [Anaeromyxobacteraceae bacterium]|jgi:hypothetical protein|nr:hypothetical protein [Anaeromyxobacteraceae bacterium]
MFRRIAYVAAFVATAFVVACGGSGSGIDTAEIQAFGTAAQGVSSAVEDYGVAAAAMTSPATCASVHATYDGRARPLVGQMQGMGPAMDAMMGSMGHMDAEDFGCSADAMRAELDRHAAAACASPTDVSVDAAEARQHVAAMEQWAGHAIGRDHDLASMAGMPMGGMGGGATGGHCVRGAGGTFTLQP